MKTLITKTGSNPDTMKQRVDRAYGRGVVWIDNTRVGEWIEEGGGQFLILKPNIDALELGVSGEQVNQWWDEEMNKNKMKR